MLWGWCRSPRDAVEKQPFSLYQISYVSVGDADGQPLPMFLKFIAQIVEDSSVPPNLNPLQIIEFYIAKDHTFEDHIDQFRKRARILVNVAITDNIKGVGS